MMIYLQIIDTAEDRSKFEQLYEQYKQLMFYTAAFFVYMYKKKGGDFMKCPFCSNEMLEGFIDNLRGPVFWKQKGYRSTIFSDRKHRFNRIQLGEGNFLQGGTVDAFCCPDCKLVLIRDLYAT